MKQRLLALLLGLTLICSVPTVSFASSDEEPVKIDARLEGYKDNASMALKDASGSATSWLLLVVLSGLCVGVMFINSKRTHLD